MTRPARALSWAKISLISIFLLPNTSWANNVEIPLHVSDDNPCTSASSDTSMLITPYCTDPEYPSVIIDDETFESSPASHHKVSAHFDGTDIDIRLYFPPKEDWEGRFFHYVYPSNPAEASDTHVSFALGSGAYMVQITGTNGYRADAAAAKFSRTYASEFYNKTEHIYGYIFGGSGGSFQTVGAAENTIGVWDGSVPIIQAIPISLPLDLCARALGGLTFGHKAEEIIDAVRPGGTGDPYAILDSTQGEVLEELTRFGVPLAAWEDFEYVSRADSLAYLMADYKKADPTYKDDFFSLPGYLGTDQSPLGDILRAAWVNTTQTVVEVIMDDDGNPSKLILDDMPSIKNTNGIHALEYTLLSGAGNETSGSSSLSGTLNITEKAIYLTTGQDQTLLNSISPGSSSIHLENSWFIAMSSYHRHQVPTPADLHHYNYHNNSFPTFSQYLDPSTGKPIPVQRRPLLSFNQIGSATGAGRGNPTHTGNFTGSGKMIVLDNLLDTDAYPAHADWYKQQVARRSLEDSYRLYYSESADHIFGPVTPKSKTTMLVDFTGIIESALLYLAEWVEEGVEPPRGTDYDIVDGQVEVVAQDRGGFQASVSLDAKKEEEEETGGKRWWNLTAHIEVPRGSGGQAVVAVEWDPLSKGEFKGYGNATTTVLDRSTTTRQEGEGEGEGADETMDIRLRYDGYGDVDAGTYFPSVRVVTQRDGNRGTSFGRVMNLGRARVVVDPAS